MRWTKVFVLCSMLFVFGAAPVARADDADSGPAPYAKFIVGATSQSGLFTLWRKSGKVYVELNSSQLGKDFIQSAAPANGLGGWGMVWGEAMYAQTRLIRFTRADNKIVISWPNTFFTAQQGSARQRSIDQSFSPSVVALASIVAEDTASGKIIFDAAPFLTDVLNLTGVLKQTLNTTSPDQAYKLDTDRTYFGPTKAFPDNVIIEADQTFEADNPQTIDTVPDPRAIQLRVVYNIAVPPNDNDYMPRIFDDRVGFVASPYLAFGNDTKADQNVNYIIRWNMQPTDPTQPMSPAKHPMIFYLSNTIPDEYRPTIRAALLQWNNAFEKVGISDAVQVRDQPSDASWDPDDIRYNVVRWVTEAYPSFGAEAQWVYDPRTGQLFHTGILIDAELAYYRAANSWSYFVQPSRGTHRAPFGELADYASGKIAQAAFGRIALSLMGDSDPLSDQQYTLGVIYSVVLHESGHDMGFQHNFISADAYTAKDLQSASFTAKMGIATSVMHYAPINLWPRGQSQGMYWQKVLGPYDYYAIHWGYARVPGARTPQDEVPTLHLWAQAWSNPEYRFASDEDVSWDNGHAVDPRVQWYNLTNDSLAWCNTQLGMTKSFMQVVNQRWPQPGHSYQQERDAFGWLFVHSLSCDDIVQHYIGGEYLSRANKGDPGSGLPLQPVPRKDEQRAFVLLNEYLFSESAWHFRPSLLNSLVYTEEAPVWGGNWAYNPPPRHDLAIADLAADAQTSALQFMFQPLVLQRLDDLAMKSSPGQTMSLTDLFDWTQSAVFGDLRYKEYAPSQIRRNLQQWYARYLVALWLRPTPDTPYDAQSLARYKLGQLQGDIQYALGHKGLDELTKAHLENLNTIVTRALDTRNVLPLTSPAS
jgi:hypothetical protein